MCVLGRGYELSKLRSGITGVHQFTRIYICRADKIQFPGLGDASPIFCGILLAVKQTIFQNNLFTIVRPSYLIKSISFSCAYVFKCMNIYLLYLFLCNLPKTISRIIFLDLFLFFYSGTCCWTYLVFESWRCIKIIPNNQETFSPQQHHGSPESHPIKKYHYLRSK